MKLYTYWRSSAAYRVRIALNLKELEHELVPVDLGGDEHKQTEYRDLNPQGLVPYLVDGATGLGQSMAILEYLEEMYPPRNLLPDDTLERAAVRSFCNLIACDVHPLNNLRVLKYLTGPLGHDEKERDTWYANWIHHAFDAIEVELESHADKGPYCFGDQVTLADCLLVPQVYNARRFDVPLYKYPRIVTVADACNHLEPFIVASPDNQPDTPEHLET